MDEVEEAELVGVSSGDGEVNSIIHCWLYLFGQ
jgi:hypothetical protein